MRHILASTVAVVAIFCGAGLVEAQVTVQPIGPGCIESDDTSTIYRALVTTLYDFDFNLKVYQNGTLKHDQTTFVVNDGPAYDYSETVDVSRWGLAVSDEILFRAKATLTEGPFQGSYATANHTVAVSAPGSCFLVPGRRQDGSWA